MPETKKYYWLRLKRDFFKRHDIQIIEAMDNGKDYILFYLKLLCESVDHEGNLRFSDQIPYNEQMLATITNTNVDVVRSAIKIFSELHMMEVLDDGTYFMSEVEKLIGCETTWAEKKRKQRELVKLDNGSKRLNGELLRLPNGTTRYVDEKRYGGNGMYVLDRAGGKCEICGSEEDVVIHHKNGYSNDPQDLICLCTKCHGKVHGGEIVLPMSSTCPPIVRQEKEKEKEKELEKELEKEKDKRVNYQEIVDLYNDTCVSFPRLTKLSDSRKKAIKARLKTFTVDDFRTMYEKAEASDFLKGKNGRDWSATFDWMLKDANMTKIIDGNYDNRTGGKTADRLQESYDMMARWSEGGDS